MPNNSNNATDYLSSPIGPKSGKLDEDNSFLDQGNKNAPDIELRSGEDGVSDSAINGNVEDGDALVNVNQIINRFKQNCKNHRGNTPYMYEMGFRRFAKAVNLEQYSKRQLSGKIGKEIIISFMFDEKIVPIKSRRFYRGAIKSVWRRGLELPFPVEREDLGELPDTGRRRTPRDIEVEPHVNAVDVEEEPFLKVLVLIIMLFGVRPSHARLFRWKNVEWRDDRPYAIITDGTEPGNKKMVPVIAWIPPILAEALLLLRKTIPEATTEDPILPHRKSNGKIEHSVMMTHSEYHTQWLRFEKKHLLNHIPPAFWRHWFKTICRRVKIAKPAGKAMCGHKYRIIDMDELYDNSDQIDILGEQSMMLPNGTIGYAFPKVIESLPDIPPELLESLRDVISGKIHYSQHTEALMAYLLRKLPKPENPSSNTMVP
jgi:integrase